MPDATVLVSDTRQSMGQSEHAQCQMLWDECMRFPGRQIRHTKTAVLLLSWAPEVDDLHVQAEMGELKSVFEGLYGFEVHEKTLNLETKAQHQASSILADFVRTQDAEQGLLIIYYAGHGYPNETSESGELKMVGSRAPPSTIEHARQEFQKDPSIMWSTVSQPIGNADADVLLIFDCCHAGMLARPFSRDPRNTYEFLGACSENKGTLPPGPSSFTTALTWALRQLATKDGAFNTAELQCKLCTHDAFPKNQIPVLAPLRPGERIVISRKGLEPGTTELAPTKLEQEDKLSNSESVHVQFHFDHKVDNGDIRAMADALRKTMDRDDTKTLWNRATFRGKSSDLLSLQDLALATRVAAAWKANLGRSRRASCGVSPSDMQPLFPHRPVTEAQSMTLTIPDLGNMPERTSAASSVTNVAVGDESMPLLPKDVAEPAHDQNRQSIVFHLHAIFCKLLVIFWRTISWLTFRLGLRNSDRVVDQESQG
ncbi:Phosphatidylinositol-4-phosphate 5-kinase [Elasticomyces elasticus]|uniref:Phosphatidylinositol-4-phosphate 5-kinase n=1 Tax=Elasticomyces elasticus TaxID=574655 RepID=A0AAN7W6J2_9PEZI|nr:Phosphatidylinositol-4-phosphate 5-kinase [Elasticomyces elasticus]KAK5728587.1 hypothetical protein LTR15_001724 [Elasticomyces elasticus]